MPFKNREDLRRYQRERVAAARAAWMTGRVCEECGSTERLEVHHRDPSQKVDHRVWSWAQKRREAELAKCSVLCRPCHRKTYRRHPAGHGKSSTLYVDYGCRCEACREYQRRLARARRAKT